MSRRRLPAIPPNLTTCPQGHLAALPLESDPSVYHCGACGLDYSQTLSLPIPVTEKEQIALWALPTAQRVAQ